MRQEQDKQPLDVADVLARIRSDLDPTAASRFLQVATQYLQAALQASGAVSPELPAPVPGDFAPAEGQPLEQVIEDLRAVVAGANRLWHPMYMGHQVAPALPVAIWTEPVIAALNQSVAVREMSPTATIVEQALVDWMCGLVWGAEAKSAAGTFTSGGTEAIFTSLLAARNAALPEAALRGVRGPAAIVCGEHAHYAVRRAALQLGLGSSGAVAVRSTAGRMDPGDVERTLDRLAVEGIPVIAVVATAGTTATGAFDDLAGIGALCRDRSLWLHVDAAHGGTALLSRRHAVRLAGIERADSVSWDAHKMMLMPLPAGVVLLRDAGRLDAAFGQDAPYLFGTPAADEPASQVVDQGLRSFMCSRRADALKLWVALRRYGVSGIAAIYDALCERTRELYELLEAHPDFETLHEPSCNILCFRWVGSLEPDDSRLDTINLELRERWNRSGAGWITTTMLDSRRVLRAVLMNPFTESKHVARLVDGLARLAPAIEQRDRP
jgi:L-2,4-diaminobutyrate decarboxylase